MVLPPAYSNQSYLEAVMSFSVNIIYKKNFLGHFQNYVTGSEAMCRSIMASSSKKCSLKSVIAQNNY